MKSEARGKSGREKRSFNLGHSRGANFKSALKRAGVTKWRLAKDLNISYRTLQYWEKGTSRPSDKLQAKVAAYLGMAKPDDDHADILSRLSRLEKIAGITS